MAPIAFNFSSSLSFGGSSQAQQHRRPVGNGSGMVSKPTAIRRQSIAAKMAIPLHLDAQSQLNLTMQRNRLWEHVNLRQAHARIQREHERWRVQEDADTADEIHDSAIYDWMRMHNQMQLRVRATDLVHLQSELHMPPEVRPILRRCNNDDIYAVSFELITDAAERRDRQWIKLHNMLSIILDECDMEKTLTEHCMSPIPRNVGHYFEHLGGNRYLVTFYYNTLFPAVDATPVSIVPAVSQPMEHVATGDDDEDEALSYWSAQSDNSDDEKKKSNIVAATPPLSSASPLMEAITATATTIFSHF